MSAEPPVCCQGNPGTLAGGLWALDPAPGKRRAGLSQQLAQVCVLGKWAGGGVLAFKARPSRESRVWNSHHGGVWHQPTPLTSHNGASGAVSAPLALLPHLPNLSVAL